MTNPAAELGKLSWKKRSKGKTDKQKREMMRLLSMKAAKRRSLDKAERSIPNR